MPTTVQTGARAGSDYVIAVEFLTISLRTAVVASMVTARADGHSLQLLGPATVYLPARPDAFAALSNTAGDSFLTAMLVADITRFYAQLEPASGLIPLATDVWQSAAPDSSIDWAKLKDVWIALCSRARLPLLVLCELELLRGTDQAVRSLEIEHLVKAARLGATPCVRRDGLVVVPDWLDYRRNKRVPVGLPIWVESRAHRWRATLKDASVTGMGLTAGPGVPIGTSLTAELPDGRRLRAVVRWIDDGHIGAKFVTPLPEHELLLLNSAARGRRVKRDSES